MPCKPAKYLAYEQIKAQFAAISTQIYKKSEKSCNNHIEKVLKKSGALFRAKHCAPYAQYIISRPKHRTCHKENGEPKHLGTHSLTPHLNSLENIPPPEERFSV